MEPHDGAPYLVAINLTRRCNLACAHCYLDAACRDAPFPEELSTTALKALFADLAAMEVGMVVLTGGEPLLRPDLAELAADASARGLMTVIGSNGVLLDADRVRALKQAGVAGVGISLDSLDPEVHDAFRGLSGCWAAALAGMDHCRAQELPFQIHFSVTPDNAHEVDDVITFAREVDARVLNIFFLVCTGRGESYSGVDPATYDAVLRRVARAAAEERGLLVRARCAPHFKRLIHQDDPDLPLTRLHGYEGGGCLAGSRYCRITPEGQVTACPYMEETVGNLAETPFPSLWRNAPLFKKLREPTLRDTCGRCEYRLLCGGCRARPVAAGGDVMDEDPWCGYQPQGGPPLTPEANDEQVVLWTDEARQRLAKIPAFVRPMVERRAETHAREKGLSMVTVTTLENLRAQSPMAGSARRPNSAQSVTVSHDDLPWTGAAQKLLEEIPEFLQSGFCAMAQEAARTGGHLEVNASVMERLLEKGDTYQRQRPWDDAAEMALSEALNGRGGALVLFVGGVWEEAAERLAVRQKAKTVSAEHVRRVLETDAVGVAWSQEAQTRLDNAPAFIRSGIRKAAEFAARSEGLQEIKGDDLTRFRNRAMLRAVRRLKSLGMSELNFDGFDVAKTHVRRLRENPQAAERLAAIQEHVESKKGPLGVLDAEMMGRMRGLLRQENDA